MEPSQCKSVSGSLRMCVCVGGGSGCGYECGESTVC